MDRYNYKYLFVYYTFFSRYLFSIKSIQTHLHKNELPVAFPSFYQKTFFSLSNLCLRLLKGDIKEQYFAQYFAPFLRSPEESDDETTCLNSRRRRSVVEYTRHRKENQRHDGHRSIYCVLLKSHGGRIPKTFRVFKDTPTRSFLMVTRTKGWHEVNTPKTQCKCNKLKVQTNLRLSRTESHQAS